MLIRCAIIVALAPGVAEAQFTLNVTQVERAQPDGRTHTGTCGKDACRAVLPVKVGGDVCVLNVRVGAPTREGWGQVMFAAGPCRSGVKLAVSGYPALSGYQLDRFGAATTRFAVPFQAAKSAILPNGWDDGVVHEFATVRLDIIAVNLP